MTRAGSVEATNEGLEHLRLPDNLAKAEGVLGRGAMSTVVRARLMNVVGLVKSLVLRGEISPIWLGIDDIPYRTRKENELPEPITDPGLVIRIEEAAKQCWSELFENPLRASEEREAILSMLGLQDTTHIAIKVLTAIQEEQDPRLREEHQQRLIAESYALRKIEHPNIVRTYGIVPSSRGPCMLLELVEGETLEDFLARHPGGRLPPEAAARLVLPLARALKFAHARGIIHRDIKPGNIMIRKDGSPVLLDLGIARLMHQPSDGDPSVILGTPAYCAPEQVVGRVSEQTDVYQLGLVLFRLLAGTPAYTPDMAALEKYISVLSDLERDHPTRIRDLRPELSLRFESIVEVTRAKRLEDRFSVDELIAELGELVESGDFEGPAVTPATLSRAAKRARWIARTAEARLREGAGDSSPGKVAPS